MRVLLTSCSELKTVDFSVKFRRVVADQPSTAHVELPVSLLSPPSASSSNPSGPAVSPPTAAAPVSTLNKEKKKKHHLTTATDPLFAELRDLNFSAVGKRLNKVARRLDEDYKVLTLAFATNVLISEYE